MLNSLRIVAILSCRECRFFLQMDKLTEIMNWKRKEIAPRIRPVRDEELIRLAEKFPFRGAFRDALSSAEELSVIAEIKRRSPSAGEIADIPEFLIVEGEFASCI